LALASRADSGGAGDGDEGGWAAPRVVAYDDDDEEEEEEEDEAAAVAGRVEEFLDDLGAVAAAAAAAADVLRVDDAGFVEALLLRPLEKDEVGRLSGEYTAGLLPDDADADADADEEEEEEEDEDFGARALLVVSVCFFRSEVVDCKTTVDDVNWLHREGEVGTKARHDKRRACDPKTRRRRGSSSITSTCRIRIKVGIVVMIR
jgi:hypothetical protein